MYALCIPWFLKMVCSAYSNNCMLSVTLWFIAFLVWSSYFRFCSACTWLGLSQANGIPCHLTAFHFWRVSISFSSMLIKKVHSILCVCIYSPQISTCIYMCILWMVVRMHLFLFAFPIFHNIYLYYHNVYFPHTLLACYKQLHVLCIN